MKARFGVFVLILGVSVVFDYQTNGAYAQDPEFSQFYASPVYTNPAMAGTGKCGLTGNGGRAVINYRNQWPSLRGTFVTTAFTVDQHFDQVNGGLGLMAVRDVAGEGLLTSSSLSAVYSYLLPLSHKVFMRFGLEGQVMQRYIDFSKLKFEDQLDATRGFINKTKEPVVSSTITSPNVSSGCLVYTESFYAGFAVHNMIEPNQSFYGDPEAVLPRRYTVHMGSVIPLDKRKNSNSTFSPNALFMTQAQFTQLNLGFYMNRGPLISGVWFRQTFGEAKNADALMLLLGFRQDRFKFGYSYDITVDSKNAAVKGSHEISTSLTWCPVKRTKPYKNIPCPDM